MTAGWQLWKHLQIQVAVDNKQTVQALAKHISPQGSIKTILKKYVYASKTAISLFKSTLHLCPVKKKRVLKAVL